MPTLSRSLPSAPTAARASRRRTSPASIVLPASFTTPPSAPAQLSYAQLLGDLAARRRRYGIPWQVLAAINKVESNFGRNMGPSSAGRDRLDAVHAVDTWLAGAPMPTATASPTRGTRGRDLLRPRATSQRRAARRDIYARRLRVQPRRLVRAGGARARQHSIGTDGTLAFSLDRLQRDLDAARTGSRRGERGAARRRARRGRARVASQLACTRGPRRRHFSPTVSRSSSVRARQTRSRAADAARRRQPFDRARGCTSGARARAAGLERRTSLQRRRVAASRGADLRAAATSSRSAAARASSPRRTPTTTIPPSTSPRPRGRPIYALADGVVVRAWTEPDPRCGIGFTLSGLRRPDLDVLPPCSSRPCRFGRRPSDGRRRRSGSSVIPATRAARTSICSFSPRPPGRSRSRGSTRSRARLSAGRMPPRTRPRVTPPEPSPSPVPRPPRPPPRPSSPFPARSSPSCRRRRRRPPIRGSCSSAGPPAEPQVQGPICRQESYEPADSRIAASRGRTRARRRRRDGDTQLCRRSQHQHDGFPAGDDNGAAGDSARPRRPRARPSSSRKARSRTRASRGMSRAPCTATPRTRSSTSRRRPARSCSTRARR